MKLRYLEFLLALCNLTVSPNDEIPYSKTELGLTKVCPAERPDIASCLIFQVFVLVQYKTVWDVTTNCIGKRNYQGQVELSSPDYYNQYHLASY